MARTYRQTRRATQVEKTRRRIVEATLSLHAEVGPAATTIAAIAERAGVSRPTVYAQFPDDLALFTACGALFRELHPFPTVGGAPLDEALVLLYGYYSENRSVLAHVDRDARALPPLAESRRPLAEYLDSVADHYAAHLGAASLPVVRLALEFTTWQRLDASGLGTAQAASLMARVAVCASSSA